MIYQLALFGHPVKHSLSPQIHQEFARQFELEIQYSLIDVSNEKLHHRVQDFFAQGGHGANITVPHKQSAMSLPDQLTERAQQAGAINTLFIKDQQLWGDNTDGEGLINDLREKNIKLSNQRILIIGAGGAVQGVLPSLLKTQPSAIYIHNRTQLNAQKLAAQSKQCHVLTASDNETTFDLIINGTSLGHVGQSPPLDPEWINSSTTVYDLSYGKAAEPFLKQSCTLGAEKHYDGIGMLHHQAALAFNRWFKHMPTIKLNPFELRTES